jgi:hypothetical protein
MFSATSFIVGFMLISSGWSGWARDGQNARTAQAQKRIVNTSCDKAGAHVSYDNGQTLVQKAKSNETCSGLTISEDKGRRMADDV